MRRTELPTNIQGIRGAMEVFGKLLEYGLEVYVPVMYIRQDCVVGLNGERHADVEIKSRKPGVRVFPRLSPRFKMKMSQFLVLHYYGTDESWVLPALDAKRYFAKGRRIVLSDKTKTKLRMYKNAFDLVGSYLKG